MGGLLWLALVGVSFASDWQTFTNCVLVAGDSNDADSFIVQAGDQQIHVRLYFVDAPETSVGSDADAKRVREQARHFGLLDPARVVHYGREALTFTERALAEPFTVHTVFASALGRSAIPRVYGLVTTAAGDDLGRLLIENGYARAYGVTRALPSGEPGAVAASRLADREIQAMLLRRGAWAETDPNELFKLRESQRTEDLELRDLRTHVRQEDRAALKVELNTASARELQQLQGVGPVLAKRIIENRPYKSVDDLQRVRGINERLLESLRPHITVDGDQPDK